MKLNAVKKLKIKNPVYIRLNLNVNGLINVLNIFNNKITFYVIK